MQSWVALLLLVGSSAASANLSSSISSPSPGVDCDRVRADEMLCMACNIYHESANQSLQGKIAVGAVTINRKLSPYYPNSVCEVVWQKGQFSWNADGKPDRARNKEAWAQSVDIAKGFFVATGKPHGAFKDPTDCAFFYHADYISKPYWVKKDRMAHTQTIENHLFYKAPSLGCPYDKSILLTSN